MGMDTIELSRRENRDAPAMDVWFSVTALMAASFVAAYVWLPFAILTLALLWVTGVRAGISALKLGILTAAMLVVAISWATPLTVAVAP